LEISKFNEYSNQQEEKVQFQHKSTAGKISAELSLMTTLPVL